MRSALPGGHHGRSGCSASKVSATRNGSLTGRHLRGVDVGAGLASGEDRESPGEQLRGHDRGGGAQRAGPSGPTSVAPGAETPAVTVHTAAPSLRELVGDARGRDRGSRARSRSPSPPAPARRAPAGRDGTARSGAIRPACPTASLSVSAPISAAARAPPRARITVVARPPCQATRSSASVSRASRSSIAAAAISASSAAARRPRRARRPRSPAPTRRSRRAPRRRSSCSARSPRRQGLQGQVRDAGRASCPGSFVTAMMRGASPRARSCSATRTVSALSPGLAHQDQVVPAVQHRQPEVQELGRVGHDAPPRRRARGRSRPGSRRRRSCPCPRTPAFPPSRARHGVEGFRLRRKAGGGPPERVRLPRDLGDEWVRKVS